MADVLKKVPVREQAPKVRATNFDEVCLGYNADEAMEEASRCINCKNAKCMQGCPVSINIPAFVHEVKEGNFEKAYQIISESSALPAICGRVCPQESQCEGKCIRGIKGEAISIGKLERFVADWARQNGIRPAAPAEKNGTSYSCTYIIRSLAKDINHLETIFEFHNILFPFRLQNKSGGSFYGTTTLLCIGFLILPTSLLLLLLLGLTFLFSLFQLDVQAVKDRNPISDDTRFLRIIVDTTINHVVILLCAGFFGTFCGAILQKFLVMQQFRLLFSKKLLDFLHNRTIKSVNRLRHQNSTVMENNIRFLFFVCSQTSCTNLCSCTFFSSMTFHVSVCPSI